MFILINKEKTIAVYRQRDRRRRDLVVVGFTTTYAIRAYHYLRWEFESLSGEVFDTTLCDKVCQWLETCRWFSPGTSISSTNKTECPDITEILFKLALKTTTLYRQKL